MWKAILLLAAGLGASVWMAAGEARCFAAESSTPLKKEDAATAGPRIVLIIRHAEKPDVPGDPNLSRRGFERAAALAHVIPDHFPKPDFLIATKMSKGSARPIETITPLSKALGETIQANVADDDFAKVADDVLTNPKYQGKVVLIAWHHGKIPDLAKALGATDAPTTWNSKVFDRVWELTYAQGKVQFANLPQKALPGDEQQ